jgi:hypothetical protein
MLEQSHEQLALLSLGQSENAADSGLHFGTSRHVCGIDCNFWWLKISGRNLVFAPGGRNPRTNSCHDRFNFREIQSIALESNWKVQRRMWRQLVLEKQR